VPGVGGLEQVAMINDYIEKAWKDNKLEPAERCDDYTFLRRATLDITGRILKIDDIEKFMADPPNVRRSKLIERLLDTNEYPSHFANIWTTLLLTRSASKMYREQMHLFLYDELGKKDADWSKIAYELLTASGDTNKNGAVNFILAHLGEEIKDPKARAESGHFDMVPVTSRTTKLFLGLQTQCTQCHDHPFHDKWKQSHFWGINAFFRQVDAPKGRPVVMAQKNKMEPGQFTLVDNDKLNTSGLVFYENRKALGFYAKAKFLDGTKMPDKSNKTRRQLLADFITKSPYFGKAFVNRMWSHFFGVSFTKDGVADFGDHNLPSHPELLDKLAEDWVTKYKHNPKELVRWICNSKAYGLSSVANKTNTSQESVKFFSRMLIKPMSPETLFESLTIATQPQLAGTQDDQNRKEEWLKKLVVNFGNDEGEEATFNGTVVQALMLMNGTDINDAITGKNSKGKGKPKDDGKGPVEKAFENPKIGAEQMLGGKFNLNHQAVINYLYLTTLCRMPTKHELQTIANQKTFELPGQPHPFTMKGPEARNFWKTYYEDLLWALLNCNEFYLNH
jgi:hypothetical protein